MKKKVLFVNGHLNVGGVEKSLIDILKNIDYTKYDVDLILFEGLGDYIEEIPKEVNLIFVDLTKTYGSTLTCLKKSLKSKDYWTFLYKIILMLSAKVNQKFLFFLRINYIFRKHYNCAIAFRVGFCAEVVGNCIKSNNKICWWHHGECKYDETERKKMARTFKLFQKVVSVSYGCGEIIKKYFKILDKKIIIIPNMIDVTTIEKKSKLYYPYDASDGNIKLITIGRLSVEKNIENVVYIAMKLLEKELKNFIWYIIGDGEEFHKISNLITKYGLNDKICLMGSKNNPYPYMRYADILIHTSLVESQCLTVLEALSLHKPCIITKSIGPAEYIKSYENGILTSENPDVIANEILKLIHDKDLKEKLEINGSKVIYERYTAPKIMEKVSILFENVN